MSSRPLRAVLLGFGRIAQAYAKDTLTARYYKYAVHAQVLRDHPAIDWVGVVDPAPDALAVARSEWGVAHACRSVRELVTYCQPELAVLATPPDARLELIKAIPSLQAVLVEKPLGRNRQEAVSFLNYCRERGIRVQVNYWRRADVTYRRLASGGLADLLGKPQVATCVYGGGLVNNGSHMIDFLRMLCGEIQSVQAFGKAACSRELPLAGDVEAVFATRTSDGSITTFLPVDFRNYRENGLDIWGERGRLSILLEGLYAASFPVGPHRALQESHELTSDRPVPLGVTVGEAFYQMYDNLVANLAEDAPLFSPGESALATADTVEAVLESLLQGGKNIDIPTSAGGRNG